MDDHPMSIEIQAAADFETLNDWTFRPVWECDCGTVLEAGRDIDNEEPDTFCEGCARRYRHRLISDRTWRVVQLRASE
jgi:hypothetical protein